MLYLFQRVKDFKLSVSKILFFIFFILVNTLGFILVGVELSVILRRQNCRFYVISRFLFH
jgi:hypothetical protein